MCENYLYSTTTQGQNVKHERIHVGCKAVEEYTNEQWKQKV